MQSRRRRLGKEEGEVGGGGAGGRTAKALQQHAAAIGALSRERLGLRYDDAAVAPLGDGRGGGIPSR